MFEFIAPGWSSGPVHVAISFWQRWRGVRGVPAGSGVLIRGRSVHGFGLSTPLTVVGLDRENLVIRVATLVPGRWVVCRGATAMLELPLRTITPPAGARLVRVPRVM